MAWIIVNKWGDQLKNEMFQSQEDALDWIAEHCKQRNLLFVQENR